MRKPRSQAAKQKTIATFAENARKRQDYDKLVEHKRLLVALVREGIECGSSVRAFLSWAERAKFIVGSEPVSAPETLSCLHKWTVLGAPRNPNPDQICEGGCGETYAAVNAANRIPSQEK